MRGRGRRPPARRPRRRGARRACPTPAPSRCRSRSSTWWPATRARTVPSSCSTPPPATAWAPNRSGPPSRCSSATAGWCAASSGPTASSGSGATATCSASSAVGRWPRSARRSSRSTPPPSPRFLPRWHGIGQARRGTDALVDVVAQLQGAPLVASALDRDILRARLPEHEPADLDALCTSGDVVWVGAGAIGSNDGRIRLAFRDQAGLLLSPVDGFEPDPLHTALARPPRAARRLVLGRPHPRRPAGRAAVRRSHRPRRAVGPRVGGARHERLAGAAARVRRHRRPALGRPVELARAARAVALDPAGWLASARRRAPGAGRSSAPLLEPLPAGHRGRPRPCAAAARALRRAHPRGGPRRGRRGRLRGRVPRPQGPGGARAGAPGLLRRRARGRPVRGAGRRRSAPRRARTTTASRRSCWPPPIPPSPSAPPSRGPSPPGVRPGRRARWWCWPGPTPSPTSSAAPTRCCASPPRPTTTAGSTRWRGWWRRVASGRSRSGPSTASTSTRPTPRCTRPSRRRLPAGLQGLGQASPLRVDVLQSSE